MRALRRSGFLPFRDLRQWFEDIIQATDDAKAFIGEDSFEEYVSNKMKRSAVRHEVLTASEAAIRLGPDAARLIPAHDWSGLRGIGNVIRHAYDGVDDRYMWEAVKIELPALRILII